MILGKMLEALRHWVRPPADKTMGELIQRERLAELNAREAMAELKTQRRAIDCRPTITPNLDRLDHKLADLDLKMRKVLINGG